METNNLYKECETCEGEGKVLINGTPNNDPQHDEIEDCIHCWSGKVPNDELLRERYDEYEWLISSMRDKINKLQEMIEKAEEHKSWLKNKASSNYQRYF